MSGRQGTDDMAPTRRRVGVEAHLSNGGCPRAPARDSSEDRTLMVFGDAKKVVEDVVKALD